MLYVLNNKFSYCTKFKQKMYLHHQLDQWWATNFVRGPHCAFIRVSRATFRPKRLFQCYKNWFSRAVCCSLLSQITGAQNGRANIGFARVHLFPTSGVTFSSNECVWSKHICCIKIYHHKYDYFSFRRYLSSRLCQHQFPLRRWIFFQVLRHTSKSEQYIQLWCKLHR